MVATPQKRNIAIVILLILAIASFHLLTIRGGHNWGDDFALYIQEAADIAHGSSYTQSNYIFNPQNPGVGPKTYPPVYPLLLSPVYATSGLSLTPMKVENVILFAAFLSVFCALIWSELPLAYVVAAIVILGFNPSLWLLKDNIVSETAFLFFLYVCFLFVKRVYGTNPGDHRIGNAAVLGVLIYLCYGTRTAGILLIPALLCFEAVHFRRITRFASVTMAVFAGLWLLQNAFGSADNGYADMLRSAWVDPKAILERAVGYTRDLSLILAGEANRPLRFLLFSCFSAFAVLGYASRLIKRATIWEFYVPLYLAVTILWPYPGGYRYLFPIVPLYVTYSFVGFHQIVSTRFQRQEKFAFAALLILLALSYQSTYSRTTFGPLPDGIAKMETLQFFEYVKNETEPHAIFIFRKPKALGLFGERQTSVYPETGTDKQLWEYIEGIHAGYVVKAPMDEPFWHAFLERNKSRLLETYSNADFKVYRILPEGAARAASLK